MKIVNPSLLIQYRIPGRCELCGKLCRKREVHHAVYARGLGAGRQLDISLNIISCGSTKDMHECHSKINTVEGRERCIAIIAEREKCTPSVVVECCSFILFQLDKDWSSVKKVEKILASDLSSIGREMVLRELKTAGVISCQ